MTARFSQGKYSLAISDRDGQAYPYTEMVREWTGAWVHISEFEKKSPQLELKVTGGDPQALMHPRTARTEFATTTLLQHNPFFTTTAGTAVVRVYQPGHARTIRKYLPILRTTYSGSWNRNFYKPCCNLC